MVDIPRDDLHHDRGYRIRCMRGMITQIREDYDECKRMWERNGNGPGDPFEEERLWRIICWMKQEISLIKEQGKKEIEGITWGEIDRIDKDIKHIEQTINRITVNRYNDINYKIK